MSHHTISDLLDVYMHTYIRYISIDIYLYKAATGLIFKRHHSAISSMLTHAHQHHSTLLIQCFDLPLFQLTEHHDASAIASPSIFLLAEKHGPRQHSCIIIQ